MPESLFVPIAKQIIRDHPIITIRENESMWIYDHTKGCFVPNAKTYIGEILVHTAYYSRSNYNEILSAIKHLTMTSIDGFESDTNIINLINLKNGIYDITNDKILNFDPKYRFKYNLNIPFDNNATCTVFEKMVRKMTMTPERYDILQRWFGYHLFRSSSKVEKKSLVIKGDTDTGKTTLFWVLGQLIGEGNYTSYSLQDISNDHNKYYIADMYGKLANIHGDLPALGPRDVSAFKMLTGADKVSARTIHKMPFNYTGNIKLSFACNDFPYIKEPVLSDKAFWNRIMVLIADKGYEQKDDYIKDKLKDELSGILNWTIKGYKDYVKYGFNCYHQNWEETRNVWIKNMPVVDYSSRSKIIPEDVIIKFPEVNVK